MIAAARDACLVGLVVALAGCGGPITGAPLSAVVLIESPSTEGRVSVALLRRGMRVVAAPPAREEEGVEDPLPAARAELAHASEAQQSFHESDALASLSRAETLASSRGISPGARAVLADIGFLRAWLHLSAGRNPEAEREAASALVFADPGAPDPARYPPEVVALFDRARSVAVPTGTLRVEVEGSPDAQIFLDGRAAGESPLVARGLSAGPHGLVIEAPGAETIVDRIDVPADGEVARTYAPTTLDTEALADAARAGGTRAASLLAEELGVEGVVLGREFPRGRRIVVAAQWIPVHGTGWSMEGRGATAFSAADELARRLVPAAAVASSSRPNLWLVGGVVLAATAGVGIALAISASEHDSGGGSVRCCEPP